MTIKAMLECNAGLMPEERQSLHALLVRPYQTLEDVERAVTAVFPAWFLYRGGSHVSLAVRGYSTAHGESPRLAVWTEEQPAVDYFEHESLGIERAIERAYARGRTWAEAHYAEVDSIDAAYREADKYGHGSVEDAFNEGWNDRADELREAAAEEMHEAELGHGEG